MFESIVPVLIEALKEQQAGLERYEKEIHNNRQSAVIHLVLKQLSLSEQANKIGEMSLK